MVSTVAPPIKRKPPKSPYRSPEQLTVNQVDVLQEVAYGNDPCETLKHEHRFTNLQMFIYRGWVIFNAQDQYELTDDGKAGLRKALDHAR
jgi:hypothetical protein